jgi:hypothetical protein
MDPGQMIRVTGRRERLRVTRVRTDVERHGDFVEHRMHVETTLVRPRRRRRNAMPDNVVPMPLGRDAVVTDFLRYHVLVRVYEGDADAWIRRLQSRGDDRDGDLRFARRLRARLRDDPSLLDSIRNMVDATPFWKAVG